MHYPAIKEKAILLRKQGKSIQDVALLLNVSKSTISFWCRDIQLSKKAIYTISSNGKNKLLAAILRNSEMQRMERIQRTKDNKMKGATMTASLSDRELLMVGIGLYWGEGYKECNGELGFTNSNPHIIQFFVRWIALFGITKDDLLFRLTINKSFESRSEEIKKFWIDLLNVQEDQFSKTTIIKTKLKKENQNSLERYKGILRVKVRKGLALKNQILGAIEELYTSNH